MGWSSRRPRRAGRSKRPFGVLIGLDTVSDTAESMPSFRSTSTAASWRAASRTITSGCRARAARCWCASWRSARLPPAILHEVPMRVIGLAVVLTVMFLAPLAAWAQQAEKVRRIGFLSAAIGASETADALRQGLREHGYVEGHNLLIEWRFAEGRYDRLPGFAEELGRLKVEVVVTLSTEAALAAKNATESIPIIFTQVSDPVASGVVASLARPGGNLSGFSLVAVELTGKRLELLKGAVPSLKSAIILCHRGSPVNALALNEAEIAAQRLGLEARVVEVRDADELEPAFTTMARERANGV